MNVQKTGSTISLFTKAVGLASLGAALLISLPSSAQTMRSAGQQTSGDSNSGTYVPPATPSDTTPRPSTDPTYGNPSGTTDRGPESGATNSTPVEGQPQGLSEREGSGQYGNSTNQPSTRNRPMSQRQNNSGPSAVGEGFPGPSESPSGSPSVPGVSTYDNPARAK